MAVETKIPETGFKATENLNPNLLYIKNPFSGSLGENGKIGSILKKASGNAMVGMALGAAAGAIVGPTVSYLASGGTPLSELMYHATLNSKSVWSMNAGEIYQQVVTASAFAGMPIGALIGSGISNGKSKI
jgi:hypothetical protein